MQGKRIPTIIGLLLILGSLSLFSFIIHQKTTISSQAATQQPATQVTFSNVSDTSFTITWITDQPSPGFITVKNPQQESFIAYDDRDQAGVGTGNSASVGQYTTHIVTMRNATADTLYQVNIENGSKNSNTSHVYEIMTGPTLQNPSTLEPAYGNVALPDGSPAQWALVFITLDESQLLSSYVSPSGTWVIPLNVARTKDLQSYLTNQDRIDETIIVQTTLGQSNAITDTKNDNPVPTMVIGKEYDFRKIQANAIPTVFPTPKKGPFLTTITSPKNGAALPTDLPLFTGTGIPGETIAIIVGINTPIGGKTTVGPDGLWRYTPKKPIAAGKQSITITTNDEKGKPFALTTMFEILKSGTQVLGDATPSGAIAPTTASTPTPTPEILIGDPIPETGFSMPIMIVLLMGLSSIVTGIYISQQHKTV